MIIVLFSVSVALDLAYNGNADVGSRRVAVILIYVVLSVRLIAYQKVTRLQFLEFINAFNYLIVFSQIIDIEPLQFSPHT